MSILDHLNWRYAAKAMNGDVVPEETVDYIVEAARLAPSSSGTQPIHVFVVTDKAMIADIAPHTFNNKQLNDASHLLVFTVWDTYDEDRVNDAFTRANQFRGVPESATDEYRTNLLARFAKQNPEDHFQHAARQSYMAAMCAMLAAAEKQVDCTPMEGFSSKKVDAVLNLAEKGLRSTLLLPLGYRNPEKDWWLKLKKYRQPTDMYVTRV